MVETVRAVGSIFIIIAAASVFGRVLTLYGAADGLAVWITSIRPAPLCSLASTSCTSSWVAWSTPYLSFWCSCRSIMPTVLKLGIDPVHFGVLTVFNLLIGLVTPPYGLTMFLLCKLAGISLLEFWRYMWPIFLTMIVALILITIYPPIATWLPNLVMGTS